MSEASEQEPERADGALDATTEGASRASWVRESVAGVAIVGLLAAIAVPVTIDQRKKGVDARVKEDLTAVEQAVTDWIATNEQLPAMRIDGVTVYLDDVEVATLHPNTVMSELEGASTTTWCLTAMDPAGKHAADPGYRYRASEEKIGTGEC